MRWEPFVHFWGFGLLRMSTSLKWSELFFNLLKLLLTLLLNVESIAQTFFYEMLFMLALCKFSTWLDDFGSTDGGYIVSILSVYRLL